MIISFSHPQHIGLAKRFTKLLSKDSRFEQIGRTTMGLVCFRLKVGPPKYLICKTYEAEEVRLIETDIKIYKNQ